MEFNPFFKISSQVFASFSNCNHLSISASIHSLLDWFKLPTNANYRGLLCVGSADARSYQ